MSVDEMIDELVGNEQIMGIVEDTTENLRKAGMPEGMLDQVTETIKEISRETYMDCYSVEDIEELVAFYRTDFGKRMLAAGRRAMRLMQPKMEARLMKMFFSGE